MLNWCVKMQYQSDVEWEYDFVGDSLYINVIRDYKYRESIEITDDVILDIGEDNRPVALEILDASKLFKLEKQYIRQLVGLKANIKITEEIISIKASFSFLVHQKSTPKPLNEQTVNDISLPVFETNFATATAK